MNMIMVIILYRPDQSFDCVLIQTVVRDGRKRTCECDPISHLPTDVDFEPQTEASGDYGRAESETVQARRHSSIKSAHGRRAFAEEAS